VGRVFVDLVDLVLAVPYSHVLHTFLFSVPWKAMWLMADSWAGFRCLGNWTARRQLEG